MHCPYARLRLGVCRTCRYLLSGHSNRAQGINFVEISDLDLSAVGFVSSGDQLFVFRFINVSFFRRGGEHDPSGSC